MTDFATDLSDLLAGARSFAWRFEQQPRYASDFHPGHFERWLAGNPVTPPPGHDQWRETVRSLVSRGVEVVRVRVHEDPPTEVNRWARFKGRWNSEAGEEMRYADRRELAPLLLGSNDWWLVDRSELLVMTFDADGAMTGHWVTTEPSAVAAAVSAWSALLQLSEPDGSAPGGAP